MLGLEPWEAGGCLAGRMEALGMKCFADVVEEHVFFGVGWDGRCGQVGGFAGGYGKG